MVYIFIEKVTTASGELYEERDHLILGYISKFFEMGLKIAD